MPIMKLFFVFCFLIHTYCWRLIMQTSNFNRTSFFEHEGICTKKTRKRKWCDAFERTQHANEEDDEEEEEEENWVKKFVKCFHHQHLWEWANELPSSFLFILIRAHIHKRTSGRYTWERKRRERESKDIQSSSVTTTWCGFSFSHHQRRRTEHKREGERRWQW